MQLRPYQAKCKQDIYDQWDAGVKNVLAVLPTGAGKTVIFSDVLKDHVGPSCAIAHRQELVCQISLALGRDGVRHKIIGPDKVVRLINQVHMFEFGKSYYNANSTCAVAGVDTLIRNKKKLKRWADSVTKWVIDEAHHITKKNKWGTSVDMFPNAVGLGVTATPMRADGKGLGRHVDGVFDVMVEGPTMRELIDMGYLTEYRIFAPKTDDLNLGEVTVSKSTGEYNPNQLKVAVRKSHVIGDVVAHYIRIANGKLGITFCTDVETAGDVAKAFNDACVPAVMVSADTPDAERAAISRKLRERKLLQLVNVDIFGEGYDLPAIEVVSMARPTQSYGLYVQQFGRACRLLDGKTHALIIDHVGNVERHGLPDAPRVWTLDRREKRSGDGPNDAIPTTTCSNPAKPLCLSVYERFHSKCPFCGYKPVPQARSGPEYVDGDLHELDAETLAAMRGAIEHTDRSVEDVHHEMNQKYAPRVAVLTAMKRHAEMQEMQEALRASMSWWAGVQKSKGRSLSESYRRFYHMFGVDVMTAQTLKRKDAEALANKINIFLTRD